MEFDFTTLNTGGGVHPFVAEHGVTDPGIISFSVAEMRLNLAPGIVEGMHRIVDRQSFGYAPPEKARYDAALVRWMKERHGWDIQPQWAVQCAGVIAAIGVALEAFTAPGDGVLIQMPVYHHFFQEILAHGRRVVESPLQVENGRYVIDFADLREKARDAKMLLLCSPHNPVGRVWTREELQKIGEICRENDLLVVSDEIHFDLDFTGGHVVFPLAVPEWKDRTIVCTAPSKTFNLAGNSLSNIIIENEDLRRRFSEKAGHFVGTFAYAATTAAYETGGPWLDALLRHLRHNRQVLSDRLSRIAPGAVLYPLEGTYLQWIDFSCLGLSQEQLMAWLERAQVFVSSGTDFGKEGLGHIRFNLACPTASLEAAMDRLERSGR